MARLEDIVEPSRTRIAELDCPTFETTPWVDADPPGKHRIAMLSTAGLTQTGQEPFLPGDPDYRIIDQDSPDGDILMSHVSVNFDRTGFQQDLEVVLPRRRLAELADQGAIAGVAAHHYSFMGATDPRQMEPLCARLIEDLNRDGATAVLLLPV